jgi:hypothetical protein
MLLVPSMKNRANNLQGATPASRVRFLQNCVFVCLHASATVEDKSEFLERNEDKWLQLFSRLYNKRMRRPLHNPDEEIYLASLLWGLLESAENRGSSLYCLQSDSSPSSGNVLSDILNLIGVRVISQPLKFGDIQQEDANRILSRCKLFEGTGDVSVASFTDQIRRYVPLGRRGIGKLPGSLSHTIQDETANGVWQEM